MPGQAKIRIRDKQWQVALATSPLERATGLGGIPSIPQGSGMIFDLGYEQIITVTTLPMLFSLDIAFISDSLMVVDVGRNVPPGLVVSSSVPARFFLEVNSGELVDVDTGDKVQVELLPVGVSQTADWLSPFFSFMTFTIMGVFIAAIAKMLVKAALAKPKEKSVLHGPRGEKLLPQTSPALKQRWYEKGVEAGKTDGWMAVEETLPETLEAHRDLIKDASDLVWTDIDLWEGTDHFTILYGSKLWDDAEGDIDAYQDLRSEFWEGYLAGRKAIGRDIYEIARKLLKRERAGFLTKTVKPTRYDISVEAWQERDRLGIWIEDNRTGRAIAEWWDDEAREMFEQGFFKPGVPRYSWEKPSREFVDSVLDYAESVGLLAKTSLPGITSPYLPQTSTTTKLNGLQIVRAYKQVSAHGEDKISVQLEAWALFPRGKRPHLISMYRAGDKYVVSPLYAHIEHWVEVPVDKVKAWIKSLPVRHFEPMAVAPKYREEAERLAKQVDEPMDILPLASKIQNTTYYRPGEVAEYQGERVKVQQHIADRVSIWIPSRQEEVWVKAEKLKKLKQAAKPKVTPTEEAKPRAPSKLKYFADSPEFLTQTVDAIGYREKLDKTFQEAIARAKGLR